MRDRTSAVFLLVLLAFLGIRNFPLSAPPEAAHAPPARPAADAAKAPATQPAAPWLRDEFWHPLAHYWQPDALAQGAPRDWPPWDGFPNVPGHRVESLVMMVPDPVDSSSGYRFDRILDAFQRA